MGPAFLCDTASGTDLALHLCRGSLAFRPELLGSFRPAGKFRSNELPAVTADSRPVCPRPRWPSVHQWIRLSESMGGRECAAPGRTAGGSRGERWADPWGWLPPPCRPPEDRPSSLGWPGHRRHAAWKPPGPSRECRERGAVVLLRGTGPALQRAFRAQWDPLNENRRCGS